MSYPVKASIARPVPPRAVQSVPVRVKIARPAYVLGDLNGDGSVTIEDATILMKIAIDITPVTEIRKLSGDLNGDGVFNLKDVILPLRKIVGL